MNGKPWTPADDAQLRLLYAKHSKAAIAKRLGRTEIAIRTRAKKLRIAQPPHLWSAAEQVTFRRLYPDTDNTVLATLFNRTVSSIHHQAKHLGVKKSRDYLSEYSRRLNAKREAMGLTPGRFHAGQTPWNKGKRGWTAPGTEHTQFKKGNRPHTWQPLGHEVVREGYLWRKMTDDGPPHKHYRPVHVMCWEAAHGPVQPGHIVVFRDKADRTQNITIDRLELISRAENMRRNSYHVNYPPEIRGAIALRARLTRVINEKTRQMEQP